MKIKVLLVAVLFSVTFKALSQGKKYLLVITNENYKVEEFYDGGESGVSFQKSYPIKVKHAIKTSKKVIHDFTSHKIVKPENVYHLKNTPDSILTQKLNMIATEIEYGSQLYIYYIGLGYIYLETDYRTEKKHLNPVISPVNFKKTETYTYDIYSNGLKWETLIGFFAHKNIAIGMFSEMAMDISEIQKFRLKKTGYPNAINEIEEKYGNNLSHETEAALLDSIEQFRLQALKELNLMNFGAIENCIILSAVSLYEENIYFRKTPLFTYYLMKKINQTNKNLSMKELFAYVLENVTKQAKQNYNKQQTPQIIFSPDIQNTPNSMKLKGE